MGTFNREFTSGGLLCKLIDVANVLREGAGLSSGAYISGGATLCRRGQLRAAANCSEDPAVNFISAACNLRGSNVLRGMLRGVATVYSELTEN